LIWPDGRRSERLEEEFLEQQGVLDKAGVQRVMLQWLDLTDLDGLEALARDVIMKSG
jgi:hypothetical protein